VIEPTIKSVLQQTYSNIEYIVIDGASSDSTLKKIEPFRKCISYFMSEPDQGVYDAMNKALDKVTGDYFYFLNAGDIFVNQEVVSKLAEVAGKFKDAGIIYGNVIDIYTDGSEKRRLTPIVDKISLYQKMICHQAMLTKTQIYKTIGGFDLAYRIKADYEWLLRALANGATTHKVNLDIAYYALGGLSDTYYNTYSAKEIPKIRNKYYGPTAQKYIRRFIINPKFKNISARFLNIKWLRKFINNYI
jgi:glycosyltransferase involved in cell wall biosynthesis